MPTPEHLEVARLLLDKPPGDLSPLRVLASDEAQADHVIGFHAQQTVEKSIKAVLASREVEPPMTHDLGYLATLCAELEPLLADVATSSWLTPWAGGWRYDTEASPIDRVLAVAVAESAFDWGPFARRRSSRLTLMCVGRALRVAVSGDDLPGDPPA